MQYAWLKTLQSEKQQLIAATPKYTLTTNHTKSTKKSKTRKCYPKMTHMGADEKHEDLTGMDRIRKGSFTMKGMKLMKLTREHRSSDRLCL